MIVSLETVHELLTTIYTKIFSKKRKEVNKYDILLYLDDHYYFDILKNVSKDINEIDKEFCVIEKENFDKIFDNIGKKRNYIILNKKYKTENEKRIEFLHEILCDLLCLLYKTKNKKVRTISKIYKCENNYWNTIESLLISIDELKRQNGKVKDNSNNNSCNSSSSVIINNNNSNSNNNNAINENFINDLFKNISKENFKNKDFIITKELDKQTESTLNKLIKKYNEEYKTRFYYLFLNYYLTIQTLFLSPILDIYSDEIKHIISKIVNIKKEQYKPLTIHDILAFQYEHIQFNKSSNDNLLSPVKKVKITNDVVERGGVPTDFSKKEISKDVINSNHYLKEKTERQNHKSSYGHGRYGAGKKYKSRNYYDSRF